MGIIGMVSPGWGKIFKIKLFRLGCCTRDLCVPLFELCTTFCCINSLKMQEVAAQIQEAENLHS